MNILHHKVNLTNTEMLYLILVVLLANFKAEAEAIKNVIIIGAGPSGIAAATKLLENNITNILIIEAENRIGGRVNSVKMDNVYVDFGAEWCHGEKNNVVYEMVKQFNILIHNSGFDVIDLIYSNGSSISDSKPIKDFKDLVKAYITYEGLEIDKNEAISVGEHFLRTLNKTLLEKYKDDKESMKILKEAIPVAENVVNGLEGSFSWFKPSMNSEFEDSEGDKSLEWNGLGYRTILDVMMKKFPHPEKQLLIDDKILLNKVVKKIVWNDESDKVILTCEDGAEYKADHLIFTPSLGVLKAKHKELFHPELPERKQVAIENLGFDAVMKIVLHFTKNWWGDNLVETFIWKQEDIEKLTKEGKEWLTKILYTFSHNNTNILTLWVTGNLIPEMEKLSNETLIEGSIFVLNTFLGKKFEIVKPDYVIRSTWYSNPHFLGTYSFFTVDAFKLDFQANDELSKPLLNKKKIPFLQFAGEATNKIHSSTVHGAIETGYREATRLIQSHNGKHNLI